VSDGYAGGCKMLEKFRALGLSEVTLDALKKKGFEEPTQIQTQTIPVLLEAQTDVVGQAQTGTGKTAAFGLPIIEKLTEGAGCVQALILTPTRELALQVSEEIDSLKGRKRLGVVAIYGGQSMDQQLRRLRRGVDIVVGTPGRVKDHLGRGSLRLDGLSYVVLDEADEMLNMGFIDDVEEILGYANKDRHMLLFSATMPQRILNLAKKYMGKYKVLKSQNEQLTVSLTEQIYFEVSYSDKLEALCRIIDSESEFYGLIFCRTKVDVDNVSEKLIRRGYDAEGIHGDISQHQRERILGKFKQKQTNVLVATDVAARGIDIISLTHVINYALPQNPESYVHRIGRTGRAGKGGTAVTFVTPDEYRKLSAIKRMTKTDIQKKRIPEVEDVIYSKKMRIKKNLNDIVQSGQDKEYLDFAREILESGDSERVVSSLIKYSLGEELSVRSYGKMKSVSVDNKGTTRLFVAKGKADGISIPKILDMIRKMVDVDTRKIRDISIFDKFSFIAAPFDEAEKILQAFKKDKTRKKPIVERAKEKKKTRKH
jgi:ATP-dependent RNA helicase DeaD